MTISAVDALDEAGTLYATASTSSKIVHTSKKCLTKYVDRGIRSYNANGEMVDCKTIEHPAAIPLRAEVCEFCDPTTETTGR